LGSPVLSLLELSLLEESSGSPVDDVELSSTTPVDSEVDEDDVTFEVVLGSVVGDDEPDVDDMPVEVSGSLVVLTRSSSGSAKQPWSRKSTVTVRTRLSLPDTYLNR
jgi:hypothetical protein